MPRFVEIGPAVLEKILKVVNVISLFCNYLPLGKGMALHLNKLESPSPRDTLCQVWLKLVQVFVEKKSKIGKVYKRKNRRTYRQTTDDQKSSLELSDQVSLNLFKIFQEDKSFITLISTIERL